MYDQLRRGRGGFKEIMVGNLGATLIFVLLFTDLPLMLFGPDFIVEGTQLITVAIVHSLGTSSAP